LVLAAWAGEVNRSKQAPRRMPRTGMRENMSRFLRSRLREN
jgi:hypothetical protein